MKALIKVGYACNDHCGFCHTLHVRDVQGSAEEVHAKIERAHALGHSMVVLSGGEPTIRPELMAWATHTAELGMDFGLVTNGRMLAYPEVVEQLLERRLRYVYLSLHGGTKRVHDLMVRSQAFEETYGALANLTGKGLDLHVNCVITKHNMNHLRGLVDACLPYEDAQVKFSMVEPKGGGDVLFARLMPRVSEVAERVMDALAYAAEKTAGKAGPQFAHGAFPLCLMPGYEEAYDDLKTHAFRSMIEVGETDFFPVDDLNKLQPEETCAGCALRGPCPGLYRGYHEAFGAEELRARRREGGRGNSFNYVFVRRLAAGEGCRLRDGELGITPWDRGRDLFVRHDGKLGLYRCESRDFSDVEIARVKHEVGQVYVDASRGKASPDDFARDLVKLQRVGECASCAHEATCTGMFEPVFDDVFTRDDGTLRAMLERASGDLLDLGCGAGPYAALLQPRVEAGDVRYVGVDPDEGALASLRSRWPDAELHAAGGEDLSALGERRFDEVFVLRSWNHLADPARMLAEVRERLREGGTLTVSDDVAFGLARTPRRATRGERAKNFEHHRNDDLPQCEEVLVAHGFEILERHPVRPDTSNRWLLRARR